MNTDHVKIRRESIRWYILLSLNIARPAEIHDTKVLSYVLSIYPETTPLEMRRELDYLKDRLLVDIRKTPNGEWLASLTALGVDVAEYTVDVHPGINRPIKYW